jgi:hypothetical protein
MAENVTKQDLIDMEERIVSALKTYVNERSDKLESNLSERTEKVETSLLSAFHGWARSMEIRVRGVTTLAVGVDERISLVEERVSELERKRAS